MAAPPLNAPLNNTVPPENDPLLRFGLYELDQRSVELRKSGNKIRLRPQAMKVLAVLASRPGQLVTREELKAQIWGRETFGDFEHGLNLCINLIRGVLNDDADTPRYIETLPRQGYRFIAPVEQVPRKSLSPQLEKRLGAAAIVAGHSNVWKIPTIAAAIVLGIAIAVIAANPWDLRNRVFGSTGRVRAVAVLPLQNLTGDPGQAYFADGMTEALTTDLARMESLQVISRTSTTQYKGTTKSLPVIARELHVDAIVEGSVQRSGARVRVTAQLVRAADDRHLWANNYERDFRDILALQDDVASNIAAQIESKLGGPQPATTPATTLRVNPEAYDLYLKANYYLDSFDLQKSIEYYNQAIKLDPNYAPTYAHMARSYFFMAFFGALPPREGWGKVKELASLAIEKDDNLPEGHGALALAKLHYDWDFRGAETEFKRALGLNPNNADVRHDYAHYLMAMGRTADSEAESKRAVELDPMGDALNSCLCWHSFAAHDYDKSIRMAQKYLAAQSGDPWELTILGWNYEQEGKPGQAVSSFSKAVEATIDTPFNSFYLAALAHGHALAGNRTEAGRVLRTLADRGAKAYVSPFDLALIYVALGDKEKAFDLLRTATAERSTFLVYSKWEPRLDPLRSDPRFAQMLKQIGLPSL